MSTYTPPTGSVIHELNANMDSHEFPPIAELTQYDTSVPVVALKLWAGDLAYKVPAGATASVRMEKPDGRHVYDPALGTSADAQTVYIGITPQMTAAAGDGDVIVEIAEGGKIIGSSRVIFHIAANPVPREDMESSDEYLTLQELVAKAEAAKKAAETAQGKAEQYASEASDSKSDASASQQAAKDAQAGAEAAKAGADEAKQSAENWSKLSESYAHGQTDYEGREETEDTDNAKYYAEQASASRDAAAESETAAAGSAADAAASAKTAQSIAQGQKGYYETADALREAFPTGEGGDWAIVGDTDTIWIWDVTDSAWEDSGNKTDLTNYYTKTETDAKLTSAETVKALGAILYPVGSILINTSGTNPQTYLGGTWIAWGAGRVPVGVDTTQAEFATVEKQNGEKTHTLTTVEMPSHKHAIGQNNNTSFISFGTNAYIGGSAAEKGWGKQSDVFDTYGLLLTSTQSMWTKGTSYLQGVAVATGNNGAHNNLQPYITCYMWKRTA